MISSTFPTKNGDFLKKYLLFSSPAFASLGVVSCRNEKD
jgi:hypothetical protein